MKTIEALDQLLKEKPSGGSWDDHRAWEGKVAEYLSAAFGAGEGKRFSSIKDKDLTVVIARQCGRLLALQHVEPVRQAQRVRNTTKAKARIALRCVGPDSIGMEDTVPIPQAVDVALVTALPMELDAILRHGRGWTRSRATSPSPRTYHFSRTHSGVLVAATCALGMGQLNAALAAKDIITACKPKKIILVGIAGGLGPNVHLGDIVVSDQIVDYELGKVTDGLMYPRWSVYRSDPALQDRLRTFRNTDWFSSVTTPRPDGPNVDAPRVIHDVVLSGNKVIADASAAGALVSVWQRAAAIEMEGAGVAAALHQTPNAPGFIIIKAICDKADSKKDDRWQVYAADVAAAFTLCFIQAVLQPADTEPVPPEQEPPIAAGEISIRPLRLALSAAFNMSELRVLVADLDVDWDEIAGEVKSEKLVQLIWYLKRRSRIKDLVALIKKERPGLLESYSKPLDLLKDETDLPEL